LTSQKVVHRGLCGTYRIWRLHYSCHDKNKLRLLPPLHICRLRGYLKNSTMKDRISFLTARCSRQLSFMTPELLIQQSSKVLNIQSK
jgi:hypothetical protein